MRLEEEVVKLRAENTALRQLVEGLNAQVAALTERLRELEEQKPGPPTFVKANRARRERKEGGRKKRASEHNRGRKREQPTQIERHALARCPSCAYQLRGASLQYRRQVIELPEPQPMTVTEHQLIKRWCPVCQAWQAPRINWQEQVVGQGRVGVRLAALVGYLRQSLRLPLRQIQAYLVAVHQVQLSVGELSELLQRMHQHVQGAISALQAAAQAQAVLHGDETGWREDGQNGYVWCLVSGGAEPVRYYEYDASRSQAVVQRLLQGFGGHLVSDFLGSYNVYSGPHQRCWVHLLRDLKKLQEEQSEDSAVVAWTLAVRWQYEHARSEAEGLAAEERPTLYQRLRRQTELLGLQYAQVKQHPCQALAKRLLRHLEELYQFVLHPQVPADNNLAERALRSVVVQRKISGGTRSPAGTQTRLGLASLFETWHARGLNPLAEFQRLLVQPPHAPP